MSVKILRHIEDYPIIQVGEYKFAGWYADKESMKISGNEKDLVRFNNDQAVDGFYQGEMWEVIKNERLSSFPGDIIISIDKIDYSKILPLNEIPFPFGDVSWEKKGKEAFIEFEAMAFYTYDDGSKGEEAWNLKWTVDYYFDAISSFEQLPNVEVKRSADEWSSNLSIRFKSNLSKELSDIFYDSLKQLKDVLRRAELTLSGLGSILELSDMWKKRDDVKNEKAWQKILKANSWIISLAFNQPLLLFEDEGYLGGKNIGNKRGKVVDFVYQNRFTNNIFLVEIKTPKTKLLGAKYRDTFSLSKDLTGSINQILSYINTINKEYFSLNSKSLREFDFLSTKALLIVGSINELDDSKRITFELFRNSLSNVEIITYEELFEKIFMILKIFEKKNYWA